MFPVAIGRDGLTVNDSQTETTIRRDGGGGIILRPEEADALFKEMAKRRGKLVLELAPDLARKAGVL